MQEEKQLAAHTQSNPDLSDGSLQTGSTFAKALIAISLWDQR
jgi:hypothetical protein